MRRFRQRDLPARTLNDDMVELPGMGVVGGMVPAMDNRDECKKESKKYIINIMSVRVIVSIVFMLLLGSCFAIIAKQFSPAASAQANVETTFTNSNSNKLYDDSAKTKTYVLKLTRGVNAAAARELPKGWQTFGVLQLRNHFECDLFDRELKLPSMKKWQMILDAYNKEVESSIKFDKFVPPTRGYLFDESSTRYLIGARRNNEGTPPFHAKSINMGRHRGLFASWDIKKGEVVHDGTRSDLVFPDAMAYRRFVLSLPRNAACDVISWTWTQRLVKRNGPMKIMLAINISAMLNTGVTSDQANVLPESSTSQIYYATRDIKRGEEILTDATFRDRRDFAATDLGLDM